jgi:hypothetical protein
LTHFGQAEPTGNAALDADPDGDGVVNLLEYAFDGDPWGTSIQAPTILRKPTGEMVMRVESTRVDLIYRLMASPELLPAVWTAVPGGEFTSGMSSFEEKTLDLDGLPRRFFRIQVEIVSP